MKGLVFTDWPRMAGRRRGAAAADDIRDGPVTEPGLAGIVTGHCRCRDPVGIIGRAVSGRAVQSGLNAVAPKDAVLAIRSEA